MVSYALLVVIAIGLSVAVYAYLKGFAPADLPECPSETSLAIVSAECTLLTNELNITLSNRGFFNISAAYIRFGAVNKNVRTQLNLNNETFPQPFSPNSPMLSMTYDVSTIVTSPGEYVLEVQPGAIEGRRLFPCDQVITQQVIC